MRAHPSRADIWLSEECGRRGVRVSARVIQSMKERGALRKPESKVASYPTGAWKTVEALIRNGWRSNAKRATFLAFLQGLPFTEKGVRWALERSPTTPFQPPVRTTEDKIEEAREQAQDEMVDRVLRSRQAANVAVTKAIRDRGVNPAVVVDDLATVLTGGLPAVDTEHVDETFTWVRSDPPWLLTLAALFGDEESAARWQSDTENVAEEMRDFYMSLLDRGLDVPRALGDATADDMSASRERLRQVLGTLERLGGRDNFEGLASAFLVMLAHTVERRCDSKRMIQVL